jgi:hypothetical protein
VREERNFSKNSIWPDSFKNAIKTEKNWCMSCARGEKFFKKKTIWPESFKNAIKTEKNWCMSCVGVKKKILIKIR